MTFVARNAPFIRNYGKPAWVLPRKGRQLRLVVRLWLARDAAALRRVADAVLAVVTLTPAVEASAGGGASIAGARYPLAPWAVGLSERRRRVEDGGGAQVALFFARCLYHRESGAAGAKPRIVCKGARTRPSHVSPATNGAGAERSHHVVSASNATTAGSPFLPR